VDVFSCGTLHDQFQLYEDGNMQQLMVDNPQDSGVGCGFALELGLDREEGQHHVRKVFVFVPYRQMDIHNCQGAQAGLLVAGEYCEQHFIQSTDQRNNCFVLGMFNSVSPTTSPQKRF